jgi:hypothetical protein
MRAGDADRDRTAAVLRDAHAEGRLDLDELQARLTAVYAARTLGQLADLTRDLPAPAPAPAPVPVPAAPVPAPAPARRSRDVELKRAWTAWAGAVAVNVVIWLLVSLSSGDAVYFWPMWVAGPWGVVLLVRTLGSR